MAAERDVQLDPGMDHWETLMREFDGAMRRAVTRDYASFAVGELRVLGIVEMRNHEGELRTKITTEVFREEARQ